MADAVTVESNANATAEAAPPQVEAAAPRVPAAPEPVRPPPVPQRPSPSERGSRLGTLAVLRLDALAHDSSFKLRAEGDIDSLATSIARLGQLVPVDVRPVAPEGFQIVTGFRRVAALRLLKREKVIARVHPDLSDLDALRLGLAELIEHRGVEVEELKALRARLEAEGRLFPPLAETLDRVLAPPDDELAPEMVEGGEDEVDLEELAQDVIGRLAAINQDLALVTELWSALDPVLRDSLLEQLGYPEQLATYLRGIP